MRKKLLLTVTAMICVVTCALSLAACNETSTAAVEGIALDKTTLTIGADGKISGTCDIGYGVFNAFTDGNAFIATFERTSAGGAITVSNGVKSGKGSYVAGRNANNNAGVLTVTGTIEVEYGIMTREYDVIFTFNLQTAK